MKAAKIFAVAALLPGLIAVAAIRGAAAGATPSIMPNSAIFVANGSNVTAYPVGSNGDVAPIALTTDMAAPAGIARDAGGRIYLANSRSNTVTIYAANANGNVPPLAVIGGSNTGLDLPAAIALDASGKIYVLNSAANSPGINVYPALATSTGILNEAPIASIAGSQTLLDQPDAIALDSYGNIYVANELGGVVSGKSVDYGSITIYPAGSNGNIAPMATIGGNKTGLAVPRGIAVDSGGNIYAANFVNAEVGGTIKSFASITVYSAGSKGNARPIATITDADLSDPSGIALDSSRNVYVTDASAVEMFSAGSNGNVAPALTITGADTGLSFFLRGIALDSGGGIYVLNNDVGPDEIASVTSYPAGSRGDAMPTTTITSNFSGLSGASSVALDSTGNIYVLNANLRDGGGIAVYPAGSYATGSPPVSVITGNNTGLSLPIGMALDSSQNIFVLDYDNAISMYPAGTAGDVSPAAIININGSGESTASGIAVGPGGNLYVTSVPSVKCSRRSCRYIGVASVAVYPAFSAGDARPITVISGPHTGLANPLGVVVDHSGNIYVANEGRRKCTGDACGPTGPGNVEVYGPGANGDVMPIATIRGTDTGLIFPYGITLDSTGNIYVLNVNSPGFGCPACDEHSIRIFAAGSNGNVAPIATIAYPVGSNGDVAPIALTTDMAAPSGIARDSSGRVYVTNSATNTVTIYAANANGNVPPLAVIGGSRTRLSNPAGIALDASGEVYVLNRMDYSNGSITVYPPLATSTGILNEAPVTVIAGAKTQLDNPSAIALDSRGDIYIASDGGPRVPHTVDRGIITVYAAGSSGNVAPVARIRGARTGLAYPISIAVDSDGNIYAANVNTANTTADLTYYGSITVYPPGSNGNAPPGAILAGANTGFGYPGGIVLDSSRNLYVGVGNSVNVFLADSNGNVPPTRTIAGAETGLADSIGIGLDAGGNLYVLNGVGGTPQLGSVTVYPAGSIGNVAPAATITSNYTGLPYTSGIATDSAGHIYVTNTLSGVSGVAIYPAGSSATTPSIATITGDHTELYYPFGIGLDSSGNISVLNRNAQNDGAIVTRYPAGSVGDVNPSATLNIDSGKSSTTGFAVGPHGGLYLSNQGGERCDRLACYQTSPDSVAVYPAGSEGNARPSALLSGPSTKLASPSAVAVDRDGDIYVTNEGPVKCMHGCGPCFAVPDGSGSITVYAQGADGDATPTATISGAYTGLTFPYKIALDSDRNIYVLNSKPVGFACARVVKSNGRAGVQEFGTFNDSSGNSILVFAAGSNGDVAPIAVIGGPFSGLDFYGSAGIAIGPDGQ